VLWYGWDKDNFRDSGGLMVSRWYTGGVLEIQEWMNPWRPDILVLDSTTAKILQRPGAANAVAPHLNCPVDFIGVLDTQAYGPWEVYWIHWP
jgi:hypothetical protein